MTEETISATGYVVLRAKDFSGGKPRTLSVGRSVQTRPGSLGWDELAIKVNFKISRRIFEQVTPEATIVVPEDFIIHPTVEATVVLPEPEVNA